jgi:hypothetical protein
MLIYGNTPKDIRRMIWKKKFKLLSTIVVIAVAVMLIGCTTATKQAKLGDGMNKFWDSLVGKVPTKSMDE